MTAERSVDLGGAVAARPFDRPAVELRRWAIGTLLGLLWCATLLIGWRRLAGALDRPLEVPALLAVGGLVAAVTLGLRIWWRSLPAQRASSRRDWLVAILPSAAALSLGAALSLRGTQTWGLAAFWALLLAEEVWAWWPVSWRKPRGEREATRLSPSPAIDGAEKIAPHVEMLDATDGVPAGDVLLQLTRSRDADGGEQLSGWLRAPFAAGQRTATVHLSFCPQFAKTPELTVRQIDGPEVMRINQSVFSFGARLDLKLAAPAKEPLGVLLQFSARAKPSTRATTARRSTL